MPNYNSIVENLFSTWVLGLCASLKHTAYVNQMVTPKPFFIDGVVYVHLTTDYPT